MTDRRFWLGLGVTFAFLAALLWRVDFREMGSSLLAANYSFIGPGIVVYFGALYFRALRWRSILRPVRIIPTRRLYPVLLVGYMANNLLPMRIGEIVRGYYLARRESVTGSTALATIVAERIFDGVTLLLFLALATLIFPGAGLAQHVSRAVHLPEIAVVMALVLPFIVALIAMMGTAFRPAGARRLVSFLTRPLPIKLERLADSLTGRFIEGFQGLHNPRRLTIIFMLSLPVWLVEGTMYYLIALGFNLDAQFDSIWHMMAAVLMVTAMANLATSLPSSQGSIGPFEFFTVLTLGSVGVNAALGTAYAVVLHATLLLPVIAFGLLHLAINSINIGHLVRGGPLDRNHLKEE